MMQEHAPKSHAAASRPIRRRRAGDLYHLGAAADGDRRRDSLGAGLYGELGVVDGHLSSGRRRLDPDGLAEFLGTS